MALAAAIQEAKFLIQLLATIINATKEQATIYCHNQGTIALVKNLVYHQCSKHIRYRFIRIEIQKGTIKLSYIPMEENVANLFTKPISRTKLNKFFTVLNKALYRTFFFLHFNCHSFCCFFFLFPPFCKRNNKKRRKKERKKY